MRKRLGVGRWKVAALAPLFMALVVLAWPTGVVRSLAATPAQVGQWSTVVSTPTTAIHMHMLADGRVMLWRSLGNASLWDLAGGTFAAAAEAGYNLLCSGHTFLPDGRLLVSGGHYESSIGYPYVGVYNPTTNSWTRLPDMDRGRWYPTNTILPNGDVLITGGAITIGLPNRVPEVWQASSQSWRELQGATMMVPNYPMMFVAPNGK